MSQPCPICGNPVVAPGGLSVRYELRVYVFDTERCKRVFQENPDRFLDAGGEVLDTPR